MKIIEKEVLINDFKEWNEKNHKNINKTEKEVNKLIKKFREKFSIGRIEHLSKDDYVEGKESKNSFCYWVENKLIKAGDIHGSTALKFGLYYNKKKSEYIASSRYINNNESALSQIKKEIIKLINYSIDYEIDKIDLLNLTTMYRSKIAYLYNSENILPIFSESHVNKLLILFDLEYIKSETISIKKDRLFNYYKSLHLENCSPLKFMYFIYDWQFGYGFELKHVDFKDFFKKTKQVSMQIVDSVDDIFKEKDYE